MAYLEMAKSEKGLKRVEIRRCLRNEMTSLADFSFKNFLTAIYKSALISLFTFFIKEESKSRSGLSAL